MLSFSYLFLYFCLLKRYFQNPVFLIIAGFYLADYLILIKQAHLYECKKSYFNR